MSLRLSRRGALGALVALGACQKFPTAQARDAEPFRLDWTDNYLTAHGAGLPGGQLKTWYMEAYCRAGSSDREWGETTIAHRTELVSSAADQSELHLRCRLEDGVVVDHKIRAEEHGLDFRVEANNPTDKVSQVHWAQPCIRVGSFTGFEGPGGAQEDYLPKCFVFVDGKLARLPTQPWATKARYTPGQVYCPRHVDRNDVNPRPLSEIVPSNGLIGCFSKDETMLLASAWWPYQELFQGVIRCVHSDFRIGGLAPGQSKKIRGKLYLMPNDPRALLEKYRADFPEDQEPKA